MHCAVRLSQVIIMVVVGESAAECSVVVVSHAHDVRIPLHLRPASRFARTEKLQIRLPATKRKKAQHSVRFLRKGCSNDE